MSDILFLDAAKELIEKHNFSGPSLREAIPYLKKFEGKRFVLKIGGSVLNDTRLLPYLVDDVVFLNRLGIKTVLVHGGSRQMDKAMNEKGITPVKVDGLRYTDSETLELAASVFEDISREIKAEIEKDGSQVAGMILNRSTGLVKGSQMSEDYGLVGVPTKVNSDLLDALADNIIPIVPAVIADEKNSGAGFNVNADDVASAIARELKAEKLILMTDVDGVIGSDGKLISTIEASQVESLISSGVISGGMVPKVRSCVDLVKSGVEKAHIIKGGIDSFISEVLSDGGVGTEFVMHGKVSELQKNRRRQASSALV